MKIGIITDIHGRYEALKEVLIRLDGVGAIFQLGDVADFTPEVNVCYDLLKRKNILNLIGNHEQEVLTTADDCEEQVILLDDSGQERSQDFGVNEENKRFIKTFKTGLAIEKGGLRCHFSHCRKVKTGSSFTFEYLTELNLGEHYAASKAAISFCGHLHRTQVIEMNGIGVAAIREIERTTAVQLRPNTIYGFNVGMLSRNKSNSARLQYAVLDTAKKEVMLIVE